MRLRSSHFVLLMLLVCSAQVREEYAWHLREVAPSSRTGSSAALQRDSAASASRHLGRLHLELERLSSPTDLSARAATLRRAVWTVRIPAQRASAIASHTSFLRA